MKKRLVLDAGVLALYFAGRREAGEYIDMMYHGTADLYMNEINLAEFLYNYARIYGWESALARNNIIRSSPIRIVGVDEDLTLEASKLKLKYYNVLSLADSYLIATAKKLKATIVTTDHSLKKTYPGKTVVLEI